MNDHRLGICPICHDTGTTSRPYIAGIASTITACTCEADSGLCARQTPGCAPAR